MNKLNKRSKILELWMTKAHFWDDKLNKIFMENESPDWDESHNKSPDMHQDILLSIYTAIVCLQFQTRAEKLCRRNS